MIAPTPEVRPARLSSAALSAALVTMAGAAPAPAEEVRRAVILRLGLFTLARPPEDLAEVVREDPEGYRALAEDLDALAAEYKARLYALNTLRPRLRAMLTAGG